MTSEAIRAGPAAACPHIVYRDVLGPGTAAALLSYVAARESDFQPAVVRNRDSGRLRVDYGVRSSVTLLDMGPYEALLRSFLGKTVASAAEQLHISDQLTAPSDFEITAFRDGNHFAAHIDTDERAERVRVLSCVYYFAATPRRFGGGELRLYGFPTLSAQGRASPVVNVAPETDTLVIFPSWLRHEVLPVRVPSGDWMDNRFTINCWLHRA